MDGAYYNDLREPFVIADIPAVTLTAANKALYRAEDFPVLGGNYMARPGKKIKIRLFGRITTAATPGNLTLSCLWGTGADANGVSVVASAAQVLIASQTSLSWELELSIHCRTIGITGTLFATGKAFFNTAVIAVGDFLLPASLAAPSAGINLLSSLIPSVQALRSGSTVETMQVQDLEVIAMN